MRRNHTHPDWTDRFWSYVDKSGSCWVWTGGKSNGYGAFAPEYKTHFPAHRYSYELMKGPIPDGLVIDHVCRNTACVNPDHLEPVTPAENNRRGIGFSGINSRKTHCIAGHPLEGDNLYRDPKGRRQCKACRNAALRKFRAERGAGRFERERKERNAQMFAMREQGLMFKDIAEAMGVHPHTVARAVSAHQTAHQSTDDPSIPQRKAA